MTATPATLAAQLRKLSSASVVPSRIWHTTQSAGYVRDDGVSPALDTEPVASETDTLETSEDNEYGVQVSAAEPWLPGPDYVGLIWKSPLRRFTPIDEIDPQEVLDDGGDFVGGWHLV